MESNKPMLHHTPSIAELLPNYEINCNIAGCRATFKNNGSYIMHKQRHHKLPVATSSQDALENQTCYHCPAEACKYSAEMQGYFSNLRYLRQHYQKVHVPKSYVCGQCSKSFISREKLSAHKCGMVFECSVCGWTYNTREALLTHAKRKGHPQQLPPEQLEQIRAAAERLKSKVAIPRFSSNISLTVNVVPQQNTKQKSINIGSSSSSSSVKVVEKRSVEQETQTPAKHLCVASIQTEQESQQSQCVEAPLDTSKRMPDSPILSNPFDALLKDIETQTERCLLTTTCASTNTTLDPMLGQSSSHMYTQTCGDDFLNELCLTDTQTQTCWPPPALGHHGYEHSEAGVQCTSNEDEELFVSTETQTSFTQYFLNSCKSASDAATSMSAMDLSEHIDYNNQYTQTCDMLLGNLFGEQEQDLITSFQSSYTQT